jgi:eukaryotic-like serine/threonine-protein kinase
MSGEVKLSDFGIAKATTSRITSTQVGMVKGNANFMSPEQARGQPVDARSDLFSLGEVLYYCLTGELFYGGENDLDVLFKAATGPTEEHLARISMLPEPAPEVLERALAFDPRFRFQTAAEFAEAIAVPALTGDGKAQLMRLMPLLFGDELRHEAA